MTENSETGEALHFPRGGRETYDEIKALQKMSREGKFSPPPQTIEESLQQGRKVVLRGLTHTAENGVILESDDPHSKKK